MYYDDYDGFLRTRRWKRIGAFAAVLNGRSVLKLMTRQWPPSTAMPLGRLGSFRSRRRHPHRLVRSGHTGEAGDEIVCEFDHGLGRVNVSFI